MTAKDASQRPRSDSSTAAGHRAPQPLEDITQQGVAHTLTACTRCRTRKSRCDAGLPRCGPCERSGVSCEYWDPVKGRKMPRHYVITLQERILELEKALEDIGHEESDEPDQETLVRDAAVVKFQDTNEQKYLGPSSGTTMTRIVMQFAKQATGVKSIKSIISDDRVRQVEDQFASEQDKPTSKIYPLLSSFANFELPGKDLTQLILDLYNIKVQSVYPMFHEPTLGKVVKAVYGGSEDPYHRFVVYMVLAVGLQKMDTQYAGLGDSYYLAAMSYLERAVKPMNLQTLQCFILIGQYSLLTPTRTAVFYVVGMAVRLAQALGLAEEKTLRQDKNRVGGLADPLEVDMRRRLFWGVMIMDYGLSHSLGRPTMLATGQDAIDVEYFEPVDDQYITPDGILPGPFSTRKWIAIHFFKMRMLQLEIRRTLYQKKRLTPTSDSDPWYEQMHSKLISWRDASPNNDEGSGFSRTWFTGRFNTMIVFLYRPSPQIPRPTVQAAMLCYDACEFNIYMHHQQIQTRSVEMTWVFTQAIFMAINTMLWSLSYAEVRNAHSRGDVERHLKLALEDIRFAAERWPGVESARQLYVSLIDACLHIYDKEGDLPITAVSPYNMSNSSAYGNSNNSRSLTTTPTTLGKDSRSTTASLQDSLGPVPYHQNFPLAISQHEGLSMNGFLGLPQNSHMPSLQSYSSVDSQQPHYAEPQFSPLPENYDAFHWDPGHLFGPPSLGSPDYMPMVNPMMQYTPGFNGVQYDNFAEVWNPQGLPLDHGQGHGLTRQQQVELMRDLENSGMGHLEMMIEQTTAFFNPSGSRPG